MQPPDPRRGRAWLFWLGIAAYAVMYLVLYPKVPAIVDENAYLTQALLFRAGHLSYENSSIPAPEMSVNMAGRTVSKYPPGNSIFLLPFTLLGWRWVFLSGLLLAIAGAWLFRLVLHRLEPGADPAWSLAYLFYPVIVLYSRTIMSDLLVATAILAGFYFLLAGGWRAVGAGLCLGFACLVRYSALVLVPVFIFLLLVRAGQRHRRVQGLKCSMDGWGLGAAAAFCLGLMPFGLAILAYNAYCYGGPLRFPMYLTGHLSPVFLPGNIAFYVPCLLLMYPLMLVAPLLAGRRNRLLLTLPAYALLLPYCIFSYTPTFSGGLAGLAIGLRYLIPAVPFFVLGYVLMLRQLKTEVTAQGRLRIAAVTVLILINIAVQYRHDRYLRTQDHYRRRVLETVPENALLVCNAGVSELLNVAWGWRDNRHLAEYNVPMALGRIIASRDTVYAAILERPGRKSPPDEAVFEMLIAQYPARQLVSQTDRPYRFRAYRLKPSPVTPQPDPVHPARAAFLSSLFTLGFPSRQATCGRAARDQPTRNQ